MNGQMDERRMRSRGNAGRLVFLGFALVALYFLYAEHRAHLFGALPYLLLAACPLMHLLHHHGGHRHPRNRRARKNHPGQGGGGTS